MKEDTWDKTWYYLGGISFLLILIGTFVFYKERLLAFDSAYYTYFIISNGDYFVNHNRYISVITQWLPITLVGFGASLKSVLMSYSAIFGFLYFGIWLLATRGFKNAGGGVFLILIFTMAMRCKFYAAVSEITFSLIWSGLIVCWFNSVYRQLWRPSRFYAIAFLLLIPLFIAHPLGFVLISIFFVFDMLYKGQWGGGKHLMFLSIVIVLFVIRTWMTTTDGYESGRTSDLLNAWEELERLSSLPVYPMIIDYFQMEYMIPFGIFSLVVIAMIFNGKTISALFIFMASIAWTVVVALTFAELSGNVKIMIDGYLSLLGFIWALPIYYLFLKDKKWHWPQLRPRQQLLPGTLICTFLIIFSLWRIYHHHHFFEKRHHHIMSTLDNYPESRKLWVDLKDFNWHTMWFPYEVPHESLMLTSIEGPEHSATIYVDFDGRSESLLTNDPGVFYEFNQEIRLDKLPQQYFRLPTDQSYRQVSEPVWK